MTGWSSRNQWRRGRHLVVDDESGFTHYSDEVVRRWDGAIVHRSQDEPIEPQWYIRADSDPKPVDPIRPEARPGPACSTTSPYIGTTLRPYGPASHFLVGSSIGSMEIGCSFTVFPDGGPFPPRS